MAAPTERPVTGVGADPLVGRLRAVVGDGHVLVDPDLTRAYEVDWTTRFGGRSRCVVRPADTAEVAAVIRACSDAGAAIVAQGGNTGLVGGSVPAGGEVVLSTRRMTSLEPVDPARRSVVAGAGVTIAGLGAHARAAGLDIAVDFAARDTATIGGAVATNAGGSRVVRYGTTGATVRGIEAVTAAGEVLSTIDRLPKAGAGFDPTSSLIGSEGTLAVITRVRVALVPEHPVRTTALLAMETLGAAAALVPHLRRRLDDLDALELVLPAAYEAVLAHLGRRAPSGASADAGAVVLVETAGDHDTTSALGDAVASAEGVVGAEVAVDDRGRARLWALRDDMTVALSALGVPVKLDVAVPLDRLAEAWPAITSIVGECSPEATVYGFGHLAEANVHVNVLGAGPAAADVTERVLGYVASIGGAISAEHGIGRAKARWLRSVAGPAELEVMRSIKAALDPRGLLNPGTLFHEKS